MHSPRGSRPPVQGAAGSPAEHRDPGIATECPLPARLVGSLRLTESASRVGPVISIEAAVVLPGLRARMTFRDRPNRDDASVHEASIMVPLVAPGERLERPMRTIRATPARSGFTLSLCDGRGQPLVAAQRIACVDGSRSLDFPIALEAGAVVWVSTRAASGSSGPRLRLNGKLVLSRGVFARVGPGIAEGWEARGATSEVSLVTPGTMFFFHERTVESGLAGDPWVSLRFVDERGAPLCEERPVGLFHAA